MLQHCTQHWETWVFNLRKLLPDLCQHHWVTDCVHMDQVGMTSVLLIKYRCKLHSNLTLSLSPRFWHNTSLNLLVNYSPQTLVKTQSSEGSWIHFHRVKSSQSMRFARGTEDFGVETNTECVLYLNMAQAAKLCWTAKHRRCTVAPFLSHSDPNSISLSEQPDHKQLKLRFQNHGIPVARTNMALWLCKPF